MKLPIKKEYFEAIEDGMKHYDFRDAHITFINEDTKETLKKHVSDVRLIPKKKLPDELRDTDLFTDEWVIRFKLSSGDYPVDDPYLDIFEAVGTLDIVSVIFNSKSISVLRKIKELCDRRIEELK